MDRFIITGGRPLQGSVTVSGAKNSALKILAATLLLTKPIRLRNVPDLMDIRTMKRVLQTLGAKIEYNSDEKIMDVDPSGLNSTVAPYELVKTMRASFQVMGPLLARFGRAEISLPGGCAIGPRPVDFHLKAFREMGAVITTEHGYIQAVASPLHGASIYLDFPSVGATENVMMAASLTEGETIIENAAREPEVEDLANFLNGCGANIQGAGTERIAIQGVSSLEPTEHRILADRIETGTLLLAACITRSELEVVNPPMGALDTFIEKLRECGNQFEFSQNSIRVMPSRNPTGIQFTTRPHPGFPTDLQAPMMAYLTTTEGISVISEGIYENRFLHMSELLRMGGKIQLEGARALVTGGTPLSGAPVMASDLRGGAALVLAGLAADGRTEVSRVYHIDRGYERLEEKLCALGAQIERIS
ncbi:UDP-N-acetylglucosamine 1-carboxyvinyltransferase [bacterium]|jgi:UDP-N-acetylglucosamine 1-carboxyvinyltransferase|nr:UDP-N-acetylglucosamine 1-carboxyvinyltransferase [bacterium]